ncbi:MAG: hypothetical protein HQL32_16985 [Planctomycetes bacterium]|nr:hypothetical protein [Planctomycetota bacterium]
MSRRYNSYIFLWIFIQVASICITITVGMNHFARGIHSDSSGIMLLLTGIFLLLFVKNTSDYFGVLKDLRDVDSVIKEVAEISEEDRESNSHSLTIVPIGMVRKCMESFNAQVLTRHIGSIDLDKPLEPWVWNLERRYEFMRHGASVIVTLGLIGTMAGLIMTIGGLEGVMMTLGGEKGTDELIRGVSKTLGGMSTAFYTTLFGAILGGAYLKTMGLITYLAGMQGVYAISHHMQSTLMPRLKRTMPPELTEQHLKAMLQKMDTLIKRLEDKKDD